MSCWQHEVEVAREVLLQAGELALRMRAGGITAVSKADDSPVTEADKACEERISSALLAAFPGDGILGEEGASITSSNGRKWILDPIDGTRDYVRGNRFWAMLAGLESDNQIVAGVAHFPALGETYYGWRGGGAWCNGERIRVSEIADWSRAVICLNSVNGLAASPLGAGFLNWVKDCWAFRCFGGALDSMLVASGRAEAWIETSAKPWDLAPLQVIVEEAGGRFFNHDGGCSVYGGNCVICTPALETRLRAFLGLVP